MPAYIQAVDTLAAQAKGIAGFAEVDVQAAATFLARSLVVGYAAFDVEEVRLIAAYRAASSRGAYDAVWRSLVAGYPEGWTYAVHEAIELQAFANAGVNPFDAEQRNRYLPETHLIATAAELRFLYTWAEQQQFRVSEFALEWENPVRNTSTRHSAFLTALQARWGYPDPTPQEREAARQFWRQITQEEIR